MIETGISLAGRCECGSCGASGPDTEAPRPTLTSPASTDLRIRVLREILARLDGSSGDGDSATEQVGATTVRTVLADILTDMQPAPVAQQPAADSEETHRA